MQALAVGLAGLDDLSGDLYAGDASLGLFGVSSQTGDHLVGHVNTGHVPVHVLGHTGRLGNDHTQLHGLAELGCLFHELSKLLRLKNSLGLEVIRASHDLALHLGKLGIHRVAAGGNHSALGKLGRLAHQGVAGQVNTLFQLADSVQQRNGVQVEDGLCAGVVTQSGVVTGQAEDVVNAKEGGAEQVGLQTHTVAVTAGQLIDGKQSGILQHLTGSQAAQTHNGGLIVCHVDGGDAAQISLGFLYQMLNVKTFGRAYLCSYYKLALIKQFCNSHTLTSLNPCDSHALAPDISEHPNGLPVPNGGRSAPSRSPYWGLLRICRSWHRRTGR